jgi:hypothetical protein
MKLPNGQHHYYAMCQIYGNDYLFRSIAILVIKKTDKQWKDFSKAKIKELVNILGYETKLRSEITDYKARTIKTKIRFGRQTIYIMPIKNSLTEPQEKLK